MSDYLKTIAKHSSAEIERAIKGLGQDEEKLFHRCLKDIAAAMPAAEGGAKRKKKTKTLADVFQTEVVPKVKRALEKFERQEESTLDTQWNIDPKVLHLDYGNMDLNDVKKAHKRIVQQEVTAERVGLLMKYQRGLLYITAFRKRDTTMNCSQWFKRELEVLYNTARRYMRFAFLVKRYPRMIASELSFAEIEQHRDRLLAFLEKADNRVMHAQLSQPLHVSAQNHAVNLETKEVCMPPKDNEEFDTFLGENHSQGVLDEIIVHSSQSSQEGFEEDFGQLMPMPIKQELP